MNIVDLLQKQSPRRIVALGAGLIVLVGVMDWATGSELSFSVFYLIPIAMIAWLISDRRISIVAALVGAVAWLTVDLLSGRTYSSSLIPYWNAGVRLSFFLIVAFALSSLRATDARREELGHFIVHDLRSPLSNMLTSLRYLLDFSGETLDADQQELVQISVASCNRMLTLVNSLLDLAQLESGKLKPNLQPVLVQDLFDAAAAQVAAMALRSDVSVECQVAGATVVQADSDLLVRVLVNLISNALKYSPKGSTVLVRAEPHNADQVSIRVIDQGAGIPDEWVDKIFDKFAQVEARKQGMVVGSGLGLTFCQLAIEAQGGRIGLTSKVGQGTTVTCTLPML